MARCGSPATSASQHDAPAAVAAVVTEPDTVHVAMLQAPCSLSCWFLRACRLGRLQVLFWDVRVEKLLKKGKKADELLDLVWKPIHSVHLISLIGGRGCAPC